MVHVHVFTVALFFTKMVDFASPLDFLGERHPEWDLGLLNGLEGSRRALMRCRGPSMLDTMEQEAHFSSPRATLKDGVQCQSLEQAWG